MFLRSSIEGAEEVEVGHAMHEVEDEFRLSKPRRSSDSEDG